MGSDFDISGTNKYALRTIGGIFGRDDHDRFLLTDSPSQFDACFPPTLHGRTRALFETGIDALAAILLDRVGSQRPFRLWTAVNFCRDSLERLQLKLDGRIEFQSYRHPEDLRDLTRDDVLLYLHFNRYDPGCADRIESIKRQTGATIIEDFVHAPLEIGKFSGDFALNSLRKFSSVDLAVAYLGVGPSSEPRESRYRTLRKEAERIRSQFLNDPTEALEQQFLKLVRESEAALAVAEITQAHPREIQRATAFDFKTAQNLRRRNYSHLIGKLKAQLPEINVVPGDYMYLMIETPHRDRFRADLFSQRVFPVIHWADSGCEEVLSLLSLHIDQRYDSTDMDRVVAVMESTRDRLNTTLATPNGE